MKINKEKCYIRRLRKPYVRSKLPAAEETGEIALDIKAKVKSRIAYYDISYNDLCNNKLKFLGDIKMLSYCHIENKSFPL